MSIRSHLPILLTLLALLVVSTGCPTGRDRGGGDDDDGADDDDSSADDDDDGGGGGGRRGGTGCTCDATGPVPLSEGLSLLFLMGVGACVRRRRS